VTEDDRGDAACLAQVRDLLADLGAAGRGEY
jgi:hypothetical protein